MRKGRASQKGRFARGFARAHAAAAAAPVQLQGSWVAERGLTLEPYLRYTLVDKSDSVNGGGGTVTEPTNKRWQLGLKATWPPH